MKVFILCGGLGKRFKDSSFPKPLNLVRGVPMIFYVIESINEDNLSIIYNKPVLEPFNFTEIVKKRFPMKNINFIPIHYNTRGPIETLYAGLQNENFDESMVVFDNDNVYEGLDITSLPLNSNFIVYTDNPTSLQHYSFIQVDEEQNIIDIQERNPISDKICIGGYGFKNLETCKTHCLNEINRYDGTELFISKMMKIIGKLKGHYLKDAFSIGTPDDIKYNIHKTKSISNKYNSILQLNNGTLLKSGKDLSGEIYYYNFLKHKSIAKYFPQFFGTEEDSNAFTLEFIDGIQISKLYSVQGLLSDSIFMLIMYGMKNIHECGYFDNVYLTKNDIKDHYLKKLEDRKGYISTLELPDFESVYEIIHQQTIEFIHDDFPINNVIHGDFWFSNMIYRKGSVFFFDMRGKVNDILTVKGHIFYDYAKIYQSILGLDIIITDDKLPSVSERERISNLFWSHVGLSDTDVIIVKKLTGYTLFNSLYFYDDDFSKSKIDKIWHLIKNCIY
jgi:dTDP-glucose pyrophosphorylase